MLWLMICLLVSLGALLLATAGVARHIWLRRGKLRSKPESGPGRPPDRTLDPAEEVDQEVEP